MRSPISPWEPQGDATQESNVDYKRASKPRKISIALSLSAALWNELITPPHSPLHNNKASHDFWKLEITIYFIQCLLLFALMLLSNTQLQ